MSFTEAQRAFSKSGRTSSSQLDKDDDETFDEGGGNEHDVTPVYEVAGRKRYGSVGAFFKKTSLILIASGQYLDVDDDDADEGGEKEKHGGLLGLGGGDVL